MFRNIRHYVYVKKKKKCWPLQTNEEIVRKIIRNKVHIILLSIIYAGKRLGENPFIYFLRE